MSWKHKLLYTGEQLAKAEPVVSSYPNNFDKSGKLHNPKNWQRYVDDFNKCQLRIPEALFYVITQRDICDFEYYEEHYRQWIVNLHNQTKPKS